MSIDVLMGHDKDTCAIGDMPQKALDRLTNLPAIDNGADPSYYPTWNGRSMILEDDSVPHLHVVGASSTPSASGGENAPSRTDDTEDARCARLFPNSLKISGVKHICDNLLHSILSGLTVCLSFKSTHFTVQFVSFVICNLKLITIITILLLSLYRI